MEFDPMLPNAGAGQYSVPIDATARDQIRVTLLLSSDDASSWRPILLGDAQITVDHARRLSVTLARVVRILDVLREEPNR